MPNRPSAEARKRRNDLTADQWKDGLTYAESLERALALYIDKANRVARAVDSVAGKYLTNDLWAELDSLKLPDPPDPVAEAWEECAKLCHDAGLRHGKAFEITKAVFAKRGLALVKKEAGDAE